MPTYYVEMTVSFSGHLEADNEADAEAKAWTAWGDTIDKPLTYDGVEDISTSLDDDAWCEEHESYECAFCEAEEEEEND